MDSIVAALAEQVAELDALLLDLDDDGWRRPSPCEGWSVADVVLHLAQTNEMAIGSATGRFAETLHALTAGVGAAETVDDGAARMVAAERGKPGPVVGERWRAGASALVEQLCTCDPGQRVVWVAGELSARTLATTRLAETWIHTGDVATALGRTLAPTDRLWHIARLAWRTLPYAFARAGRQLSGPVAFELVSPGGEAWDFLPDAAPRTTVRGEALSLCRVAARRADPADTDLTGDGPDTEAVLELVRTYA